LESTGRITKFAVQLEVKVGEIPGKKWFDMTVLMDTPIGEEAPIKYAWLLFVVMIPT
jgi:hypothetical protein